MKRALLVVIALALIVVATGYVIASGHPCQGGETRKAAEDRARLAVICAGGSFEPSVVTDLLHDLKRLEWSGISWIDGDCWAACPVCEGRQRWGGNESGSPWDARAPRFGGHSSQCAYWRAMVKVESRARNLMERSGGRF